MTPAGAIASASWTRIEALAWPVQPRASTITTSTGSAYVSPGAPATYTPYARSTDAPDWFVASVKR